MTIPEVGGLIEFCRCEADAYGAVIGLGHKVRIVDEAGGELAVEFRHVKYAAAGFFDPSITAHQAASRLTQTLGRARALASDVKSVESLWGSLSGGPPLSLADLCRHLFGPESGRVEMLGARMLLRAHGIFFIPCAHTHRDIAFT